VVIPRAQVIEDNHFSPIADGLQGELEGVLPWVRIQFETHQEHSDVGESACVELKSRRLRAEVVDPWHVGADRDVRMIHIIGAAQGK